MKQLALVLGAILTFTAACNSGTDTVNGPQSSLQLNTDDSLQATVTSAADAVAGDVDVLNSTEATVGALDLIPASAPLFSRNNAGTAERLNSWGAASGCTRNATTGRFDCPPQSKNGLTLTRSLAYYDANGALMAQFNDTTTASINVQSTESGVRPSTTGADTIARQRDMTVTGLLGHETSRTWNGTGTRSDGGYWQDSVATRTYHTQGNAIFTNIVVQVPRAQHPWPISGTVTRQVTGTGTVVKNGKTKDFTIARTVTVTFNGTQFVPLVVGNTTYTVDLGTGKATKN